uniref:Serpin domain-containing protein n=1 Tax=Glossina austeni TaxID=7395 RepID=A0A1A9V5D2_GLOAU
MRMNASVLAIVFVLFLGSKRYLQGVRAYPPTDMKSHSLAVHNDGDNDGAIYAEPQHNKPIYIRRQTKQKNERTAPVTSSVTVTTNSTSSMPSTVKAAPATTEKPQLKSAFVYRAELPTPPERETEHPINAVNTVGTSHSNVQSDADLMKKVIGSSVVTSVSVVLNGDEPEFTDALGHKVPKPQPSLQVASPIDLLNPDRYEFFTFDEKGELVKRLMTMEQIQSIVANGDGDGPAIIHEEVLEDQNPEKNVQSILKSVQSVLDKEVESNKNATMNVRPVLDTPDVSSTWSMILPAIFGNTGDDIFPHQKPQQIVMTPDSEIIETYTKSSVSTAASTRIPKPSKRRPGVKRKPTTTTTTTELAPQVVQEELGPHESVYTGMQQYQDLAATMQNFDRVSQFHVHPIYQKLPEATIMDTASMSSTEHATLDESFSTRPDQVNAIKTTNNNNVHNAASSKRPYISKQKIKKKPLTSTTTVTPESLPKDTVTQKDSLTTIELSTKTSNIVNLQSSVTPLIKKKKKRPTRKPVQQTQTQPLVDYNPNLVEKQPAQDLPIIIMSLPIDLPADSNEYQDVMSINSLLSRINTTTTSSTYQPLPTTTFQLKPSVTQSPSTTIPSAQQIKTTTPPPPTTTTIDYDESPVITEASNVAIPGYPLHILPLSAQESEETDLNHSFTQEEEDLHTLASFDKIMQSLTQSNTLINTFTDSLNMSTDAVPLNKTEQVEESEETDSREKVDVKVTTLPSDTLSADEDSLADNKSQESHLIAHDFVTDSPANDKFDDINGTTLTMHESITEVSKAEDEEIETSEDPSDNPFHNAIETTAVQDAVTDPTWHNTEDASQEITYKPESVNTNVAFTLESDEAETTDFTDQMSTTEVFKDVKAEDGTSTNSLFYKVESPIPQHDSMVVDLQAALNMDVVKPTEQITMSDFQTQAATVASTLVDGSHSLDLNLKANSNRDKDEIQILMSDVLQQVNEHDNVIKKNTNFYDNRLSNIAQFNSSFLSMQPLKEILRNRTASYTNEDGEQHKLNDFPNNDNLADNLTNIESVAFKSEITEEYGAVDDISDTESPPATIENISIEKIHEIAITTTAQIDSDRTSTPLPIIDTNKLQNSSQSNSNEEDVDSEEDKMEDVLVTDFTKPNVLISSSVDVNASEIHNQNENQSGQADNGSSFETIYMDSATLSHIDNYFKEGNTAAPVSSSNEEDKIIEKTENWSYLQPEHDNQSDDNETNGNRKSDLDKTNDLNEYIEMTKVEIPIDNIKMTDNPAIAVKIHETTEAVMKYTESETGTADPLRTLDVNQDISTGKISTHLDSSIDTQYPIEAQENTNLLDKESLERNATNSAELPDRQTSSSQKPTNAASQESNSVTTTTNYDISEEKSPTLNSTSLESEGFDDSFDEDPYIKLGETTQRSTYTPQSSTAMPNPVNSAERETDSIPHNVKVSQSPSTENHSLESINVVQTDVASNQDIDRTVEKNDGDKVAKPTLPITSTPSTPTIASTTRRLITLKPVSYYNKQPPYTLYQEGIESLYNKYVPLAPYIQQSTTTTSKNHTHGAPVSLQSRPMQRPPQLINLMAISTQATRPPVKLEPSPLTSKGLLASVANLDEDVSVFTQLCNELAFSYWKSITSEKISSARSLVVAPFALTSMLSMIFLGARGGTSGEMNDVLRLDDMVSFNPHLIFKNITESVEKSTDNNIATAAFVRQLYSDRVNGKIMQFFKEKVQQLYSGHVEEVNFHVVNDIIRRRTNLLMKRHTMGKVLEYLRTNSVWVNGPLATISANLFQTNCSEGSTQDRDGEMFFQVHPSVRQRRLVPIPAVLFKSGFTVGYEPNLDATLVAFGRIQDTLSTIYIMPGHQNTISPSDNLDRLEKELMQTAISKNAWNNLLTSLMDRPGMEVQLPRFSHRSFVNATLGLQKMGLKGLFKSDYADLGGLTGSSNRDIYLSDIIQINTFSTCGEERIADHHHVEMYPAPPLRKRNKNVDPQDGYDVDSSEAVIDFGSLVQETALGRGFYDDLLDPKYLELPLPLRPRQARVPDTPRLRFDKPFLYFLRHNPTGMIMFIGRFNPRLLP